jgi:hypothetical protein
MKQRSDAMIAARRRSQHQLKNTYETQLSHAMSVRRAQMQAARSPTAMSPLPERRYPRAQCTARDA